MFPKTREHLNTFLAWLTKLSKIFTTVYHNKWMLFMLMCMFGVMAICEILNPFIMKDLIDMMGAAKTDGVIEVNVIAQWITTFNSSYATMTVFEQKWFLGKVLLVEFCTVFFMLWLMSFGWHLFGVWWANQIFNIKIDVVDNIFNNWDLEQFESRNPGKTLSQVGKGASSMVQAVGEISAFVVPEIPKFIMVSYMFVHFAGTKIAVIVLSYVLVIFFLAMLSHYYSIPYLDKERDLDEEFDKNVAQIISDMPSIRSYGMQDFYQNNTRKLKSAVVDNEWDMQKVFAFFGRSRQLGYMVITCGLIGYCVHDVFFGMMTAGTAVMLYSLCNRVYHPMWFIMRIITERLLRKFYRMDRIIEFNDVLPRIVEPENPVKIENPVGSLEFRDVTFEYPSSSEDKNVLRDFSLIVKPGEKIALVGPTGAGKSTVSKLVQRFYDPTSGAVLLDNVDLRDRALKDLHKNVVSVPQMLHLQDDTIRDIASFHNPMVTEEIIWHVLNEVNLREFVKDLELGLATKVGEKGVKLSGGQMQRMLLARAMVKMILFPDEVCIAVLDEATSAVDNETERQIQTAIDNVTSGLTTVMIAHRLTTVKNADRIVVLNEGEIVEQGDHVSLLAFKGYYSKLWHA